MSIKYVNVLENNTFLTLTITNVKLYQQRLFSIIIFFIFMITGPELRRKQCRLKLMEWQ